MKFLLELVVLRGLIAICLFAFGLWHDGYRLLLAPFMIEHLGWESVFYAFGLIGVIWYEPQLIPSSRV